MNTINRQHPPENLNIKGPPRARFNASAFQQALEMVRIQRDLSRKTVAEQSGVNASTLTRMAQGRRPDIDSLASLSAWAKLAINDFISPKSHGTDPEPLALITTAIMSDPALTPEARTSLDQIVKATYERLRTDRAIIPSPQKPPRRARQ